MSKLTWFSTATKMRRYMMMYNGGLDYVSFQDHRDHLSDVKIMNEANTIFRKTNKSFAKIYVAGLGLSNEEFAVFWNECVS